MNELLYSRRKKYSSLLASLLIHILLLLALYLLRSLQNLAFEIEPPKMQRQTPATVTMRTPTPRQSIPSPQQAPISQLLRKKKQKQEPEQKQIDQKNLPIRVDASEVDLQSADGVGEDRELVGSKQKKEKVAAPKAIVSAEPVNQQDKTIMHEEKAPLSAEQAAAVDEIIGPHDAGPHRHNKQIPDYFKQLISNSIRDREAPAKPAVAYAYAKTKKKKKRKITGSQLLQAFRAAYRSDQWREEYTQDSTDETPTGVENGPVDTNREYILHSLGQWKYANYNMKANASIAEAVDNYNVNFYVDEDIDSFISLSILINKDGTIQNIDLVESTGNKALDENIMKILKTAKFAPIPDHLGRSSFNYVHSTSVHMRKGLCRKARYHYRE